MSQEQPHSPIQDARVNAVIERTQAARGRPPGCGPRGGFSSRDPHANAEPDFLDFVRDPKSGFVSMTLPLKGGTELSLKVA